MSSSPVTTVPMLDAHLLKFSQAGVVTLTALAFVLQARWLVAVAPPRIGSAPQYACRQSAALRQAQGRDRSAGRAL
jgi:hypothetical protein